MIGLIATKEGMTRLFQEDGKSLPVSVLKVATNFVSQIKTIETDGYNSVQLSTQDQKEKNQTKSKIGHFNKNNISLKKYLKEFKIEDDDLKGLELGKEFDVKIFEPDVDIMAIQGPKSFELMEKVFGDKIVNLKFFGFDYFEFGGDKHLIARSGWSKQGGYEIYVEHNVSGLKLYDHLFEIGKEFNIKPGCPNLIERIESGLLSYGNDIDNGDNPYECGFDKYINIDSEVNFLGKEKLKKIKSEGIKKKLMGVMLDIDKISITGSLDLSDQDNNIIGELRSACYSPHFKKVIGIAMMKKSHWNIDQNVKASINGDICSGKVCDLPFI